ncbi:MAG: histidine--tRNA ligase [Candidatus Jorgensenbacteria bacterium]|nr:histidine--tRNA ligase [Candidatus Jorgensenbacteria bacterium]
MDKEKKIKPQLAGGFRDYGPEEAAVRGRMFDSIKRIFELFGFIPIETPGVEREEVLTGGDADFSKQIFRIAERNENDPLALRYDLTVPLARFVAQNQSKLPWPFKRYQIGGVWRAEQPQAGRYREFIQCDADIVGSSRVSADAEIIALAHETFSALGISKFLIRVNTRKILNGVAELAKFPPGKIPDVLRAIDKLDKRGWDAVERELEKLGGDVKLVKKVLDIRENNQKKALVSVRALLEDSWAATQGIDDLEKIADLLESLGVPAKSWKVDFSVARGFGYYTGMVFEIVLEDVPLIGSVGGGGRYDGLVNRFSSINAPAVGFSVGIDRLYKACEELGIIKSKQLSEALVLNFEPECETYCAEIVAGLRSAGVCAQLYLGNEESLKGQLSYAVKNNFNIVIIAGSDEKKRGAMQVRNLAERSQFEVSKDEAVRRISKTSLLKMSKFMK